MLDTFFPLGALCTVRNNVQKGMGTLGIGYWEYKVFSIQKSYRQPRKRSHLKHFTKDQRMKQKSKNLTDFLLYNHMECK